MHKYLIPFALWLSFSVSYAQLPPVSVIEEQLRRANDYFMANNPVGYAWWDRAAYAVGNVEAAKLLDEPAYWNRAETWAVQNNWDATPPRSNERLHADSHLAFQVYQDLYERDPRAIRLTESRNLLQDLIDNVSWNDGRSETLDNEADDDWWWIDAFYMAAPSLARMANLDDNEAFRTQMWEMYLWMKNTRGLFNATDGLWYRDEAQFPPGKISPNGSSVYWSRGNGWVFMGLARTLDALPADHVYRAEFEAMFQTMAAALKPRQGADGFWRSNLLDDTPYPGPETSGTSFFTAGMAWGIRNGLLDEAEYRPVIDLAWEGLSTLALKETGRVGYIQNIGFDPQPAGVNETHDFGVGAFLLAGVELIRLEGGPAQLLPRITGPDSLNLAAGQYEIAVPLHVNDSVVRSGSMQSVTWWVGDIHLGEGFSVSLNLPAGTHDLRAEVVHSDGRTYDAEFTVQVVAGEASIPATVTASDWQDPNLPSLVLDQDLNTRWSAEGVGQWLVFDLGSVLQVNEVAIAFFNGDQRQAFFEVAVSENGSDWSVVLTNQTGSGTSLGLEAFPFSEQPARYVRITGNGNSENTWNSYTEVEIHRRETGLLDGDGNGLPDAWEITRLGAVGQDADVIQAKGMSLADDFTAGTDPADPASLPVVAWADAAGSPRLRFHAAAAFGPGYTGRVRWFQVEQSSALTTPDWRPVPGLAPIPGDNLLQEVPLPDTPEPMFYRTRIWLD